MAKYEFIHHKATIFGTMFGGTEVWTTSFALGQPLGGDEGDAPTDAEAEAISDAFAAIWTPVANGFSSQFKFEGVKVSHVVTDGTADASLSRFHYRPVPVSGGAGPTNPAQISAVATLQTAIARGRGSKGRMLRATGEIWLAGMVLFGKTERLAPVADPVAGLKSVRPGTALKFPARNSAVGTVARVGTFRRSSMPS